MGFEDPVRETLRQARAQATAFDAPDWEPLERVLPADHCAGFTWMGLGPSGIRLYKHGVTRRYLNLYLDPEGDVVAYRYTRQEYVRVPLEAAIEAAFAGIETLGGVYPGDPRATPYDHEYRALRDRRLGEAGWTVISDPPPSDRDS
ncbi:MAG: hypothetical protein ACREX8_07685 [Gammaproteobacteria bacterium]